MKLKRLLAASVAGAIAVSTIAVTSLTSSADEASGPVKTWITDTSTKSTAWCGGFDSDPYVLGGKPGDVESTTKIETSAPADLSKAKSLKVTLKSATDSINGSFGVGVGADYTWASADWSINYDFDEEAWVLDGSDDESIVVSSAKELPGEGNIYTVTYTDLPSVLGGSPSENAIATFKINGFNRIGVKKDWKETPCDLLSLEIKDADGNVILQKGEVEEESSSEVEEPSSSVEESSVVDSSSNVDESSVIDSSSNNDSSSIDESSSTTDADAQYSFGVTANPSEAGIASFTADVETENTSIWNWTTDASVKKSAWATKTADGLSIGDDTVTYSIDMTKVDISKAYKVVAVIKTPTDVINGSFAGNGLKDAETGETPWLQAEWSFAPNDEEFINTAAGEGGLITITIDNLPKEFGLDESLTTVLGQEEGNIAQLKVNGLNRVGAENAWKETPVDLLSIVITDKDGNELYSEAGEPIENVKYDAGTKMNCVATAKNGYEFVNWTDAEGNEVSKEASFTYELPAADTVLTANFQAKTDDSNTDDSKTDDSKSDDSKSDDSTTKDDSSKTNSNNGSNGSNGSSGSNGTSGSDNSANTGASALAFAGVALAGAAIVITKKKK